MRDKVPGPPLYKRLGKWRYRHLATGHHVVEAWQGHVKGGLAALDQYTHPEFFGPIMAASPDMVRLLKAELEKHGCLEYCLATVLEKHLHENHKEMRNLLHKLGLLTRELT